MRLSVVKITCDLPNAKFLRYDFQNLVEPLRLVSTPPKPIVRTFHRKELIFCFISCPFCYP